MASSTARSIDRRDAAVTSALAGIVLVILGYASGVGLSPPREVSATLPRPTPTPATPALTPAPVAMPASAVPVPAAALPVVEAPHAVATHPAPMPTTAAPTPSVDPSPTPTPSADPTCSPSLVDNLAGDLPLVGEVTSLVSALLTEPLIGTSTTSATPAPTSDVVGCTVGALLGPTCCTTTATRATQTTP